MSFNIQKFGKKGLFDSTLTTETSFYASYEVELEIPEQYLAVPIRDKSVLKNAGEFPLRSNLQHEEILARFFCYENVQPTDGNSVVLTEIKNNEFKVKCRVEISVLKENFDQITGCVGTSSTLGPVGQLLDTQDFSDFKFIVSGVEFKVHRSILSLASPYFATLFKSDFKENEEKVSVNKKSPVIFQLLLEFIYKGKLPDNFSDVAMDLYVMADHYLMDILKTYCLNRVNALTINKENALKIYEFAMKYQQASLFELSWMFISR